YGRSDDTGLRGDRGARPVAPELLLFRRPDVARDRVDDGRPRGDDQPLAGEGSARGQTQDRRDSAAQLRVAPDGSRRMFADRRANRTRCAPAGSGGWQSLNRARGVSAVFRTRRKIEPQTRSWVCVENKYNPQGFLNRELTRR